MYIRNNDNDDAEAEGQAVEEFESMLHLEHDHRRKNMKRVDDFRNPILLVIDSSGIHHLSTRVCRCIGTQPIDIQLMQMDLYPASQKAPHTVFTFDVLERF